MPPDDGLFEEPERVDWDALSGRFTMVALSWGDEWCIIRGHTATGVAIELLLDGKHEHKGPCKTVTVSAAAVRPPARLRAVPDP